MRDDLIDALRRLIVEDLYVEIPPEQIGLDEGLRTVIGLDSVGFAELRVICESRFGVQIDDEDFSPENFSSIRLLANLIDQLQNGRRLPAEGVKQ
jgi:acyl carrier protein